MPKPSSGTLFWILGSLILFIVAPVINSSHPRYAWLLTLVMMIIFSMSVGYAINGRLNGIFIDYRNRLSLSKLQALCWSMLILSALYTAALLRIENEVTDPLEITLNTPLLTIMGISLASLAAAPAILNAKADNNVTAQAAQQVSQAINKPVEDIIPAGKIFSFSSAELASWLDLFRGEENTNAGSADLGKIQQFVITFILLAVYAYFLWHSFFPYALPKNPDANWLKTLPPVSDSMSWLLGISHAGYLAYKAAPHGESSTAPSSTNNTTSSGAG
ncbi:MULTISPECIES: hypothetical protein [Enterobacter]|uniref:hypothetical protein n=1 Tax=Enterobacter TaxID=547 RepID=UPI0028EF935B|nr:hypothetical protein [Enterobacter cloacae]WNT37020.1 hypothetical protein RRL13_02560 [Enterobacter cloacae]HDR2792922.1 hypothetical protein [Enterobacter asburiae]HDR2796720.1 hypothetical protein [Enterobacter asburiae]HDR2798029.1 hypothetical protein [Enterobacter asburiae]